MFKKNYYHLLHDSPQQTHLFFTLVSWLMLHGHYHKQMSNAYAISLAFMSGCQQFSKNKH